MKQQFNMDEALVTEVVLEAEIESHLSKEINNRKNS